MVWANATPAEIASAAAALATGLVIVVSLLSFMLAVGHRQSCYPHVQLKTPSWSLVNTYRQQIGCPTGDRADAARTAYTRSLALVVSVGESFSGRLAGGDVGRADIWQIYQDL
jgi:hypothetical protein